MRTYFDHETLDVYQLELQFITWVTPLLANVKQQLTASADYVDLNKTHPALRSFGVVIILLLDCARGR